MIWLFKLLPQPFNMLMMIFIYCINNNNNNKKKIEMQIVVVVVVSIVVNDLYSKTTCEWYYASLPSVE